MIEQANGFLKASIRQQFADQVGTWIQSVVLVLRGLLALVNWRRSDGARLDFQQGRRHQDEITCDLKVELTLLLPQRNKRYKLIGDRGHRDVDDIELRFTDQKQQQIQRAGKSVNGNGVTQIERRLICSHPGDPGNRHHVNLRHRVRLTTWR